MAVVIDGTAGISTPAEAVAGNLSYTGTLTGGAGVINLGSGQVYKDASGNVGIGTSSPGSRLEIKRGDTDGKIASFFQSAGYGFDFYSSQSVANVSSGYLQAFTFSTNAGSGQVERARIDSSGNLLLSTGRSSARGLLEVPYPGGSSGVPIAVSRWGDAGALINFYSTNTSTTLIGSITNSGNTNTAYNTSSDYRLKNTIAPMTGALDKVALLKPVTYKWNVDGSDGQGFIAHELQEVVEGCVTGEKDAVDADGNPQYQGIDTSFLVATLTAAIQEQQVLINALEERLTALEGAAA